MSNVSVLILFGRDRPVEHLERAVAAIRRQTRAPLETLLILNGADPGVISAVPAFRACRVVEVEDDLGWAPGRNIGARAARGAVLLFADDDGELDLRAVETVERAFDDNPHIAAFGGRVLPPGGAAEVGIPEVGNRLLRFSGGCVAIRRSIFVESGGYWDDPLLLGSPRATRGEEYHLAVKLFRRGQSIARLPGLILYHPPRPQEADDLRIGSTAGLARTFFEAFPLPVAAVGVGYKFLRDSALFLWHGNVSGIAHLAARLVAEARIALTRRDAMSWHDFSRLRAVDRGAHSTVDGVGIVQTTIPDYRAEVFDRLGELFGGRLTLFAGESHFDVSVSADHAVSHVQLANRYLLKRRLLWQSGAWRRRLCADSLLVELNPRILSTWALLAARRGLGRRTSLWGHAWSREGRTPTRDAMRRIMWSLADEVVLYTQAEVSEVAERAPRMRARAAGNALYSRSEMYADACAAPAGFICVGRLVEAKKPALLLEAFLAVKNSLGDDAQLTFVGDGPLRGTLEHRAAAYGAADAVRFAGHVSGTSAVRRLYSTCLASVLPGYAGLSLVQSVGFGVPVIVADREPHAPEIEALARGWNGVHFSAGSVTSLAGALSAIHEERAMWLERRAALAAWCAERYSIERMTEQLAGALAPALFEAESCA